MGLGLEGLSTTRARGHAVEPNIPPLLAFFRESRVLSMDFKRYES